MDPSPDPQSTRPEDGAESTYTHTRTGKVARLPKTLRDQVNQMLLDGVPFAAIIESLGDAGKDINESSIGTWKAGGHQDWLLDCRRNESLRFARDSALDLMDQKAGVTVQDAGRTVAAAQLYELLLSFDPTAFTAALVKKPEIYLRIINCLSRLSEGEATCSHRRAQQSALQAKLQPAAPGAAGNVISEEALTNIVRQTKLI